MKSRKFNHRSTFVIFFTQLKHSSDMSVTCKVVPYFKKSFRIPVLDQTPFKRTNV